MDVEFRDLIGDTQQHNRNVTNTLPELQMAYIHNTSEKQPNGLFTAPAWCDTVGFVLELLRENLGELFEELILDDVGMDGRNTIHVRRMNERQVRHVDQDFVLVPLVRLDDGHACHTLLQVRFTSEALTQELIPSQTNFCHTH